METTKTPCPQSPLFAILHGQFYQPHEILKILSKCGDFWGILRYWKTLSEVPRGELRGILQRVFVKVGGISFRVDTRRGYLCRGYPSGMTGFGTESETVNLSITHPNSPDGSLTNTHSGAVPWISRIIPCGTWKVISWFVPGPDRTFSIGGITFTWLIDGEAD